MPWLDDAEMRAWRSYIEVQFDLIKALELDLSEHGLTLGDYQVLVYLSESDDQMMRMRELSDTLQLSPSGLTRRIDGLVSNGFVERQGSADDGRVMMAVLTDSGQRLLEATAPHHVRSVRRRIFDLLDAEQIAAMESIFSDIAAGLAVADASPVP